MKNIPGWEKMTPEEQRRAEEIEQNLKDQGLEVLEVGLTGLPSRAQAMISARIDYYRQQRLQSDASTINFGDHARMARETADEILKEFPDIEMSAEDLAAIIEEEIRQNFEEFDRRMQRSEVFRFRNLPGRDYEDNI